MTHEPCIAFWIVNTYVYVPMNENSFGVELFSASPVAIAFNGMYVNRAETEFKWQIATVIELNYKRLFVKSPWALLVLSPWHSLPQRTSLNTYLLSPSASVVSVYDRKFSNRTCPAWGPMSLCAHRRDKNVVVVKWSLWHRMFQSLRLAVRTLNVRRRV